MTLLLIKQMTPSHYEIIRWWVGFDTGLWSFIHKASITEVHSIAWNCPRSWAAAGTWQTNSAFTRHWKMEELGNQQTCLFPSPFLLGLSDTWVQSYGYPACSLGTAPFLLILHLPPDVLCISLFRPFIAQALERLPSVPWEVCHIALKVVEIWL